MRSRECDHGYRRSVLLQSSPGAGRIDDEDAAGGRGLALSAEQTLSLQTHALERE